MKYKGTISISVPRLLLNEGEVLGITGNCKELGAWSKAITLDDNNLPFAKVEVRPQDSFDYKFVIADKEGHILVWEDGENRHFGIAGRKGDIKATVEAARLPRRAWKGSGIAIPVFSLRSEDDFGVGEFNDIKKLADWAALTGQAVIQLLPINDTTMTGTWEDSYPYNANSTFALHPQFIHLPDAGVVEDEEYKVLQAELNALDAVDYERVNKEKDRLLRKAFKAGWRKTCTRKDYKEFMAANGHWLIPYAAFRTLTAEYATPDFPQWGEYSKYREDKIAAYCRKNKKEVDYHCFVQYHLNRQMKEVRAYCHSKGVILKGDLPIGISRTSVDAWLYPALFHMNSQAGAPPDAFSADGQNWGFPTYNWEKMSKDGFKWWKSRLATMAEYFDAFRIDHILGFFRIWEIPIEYKSGIMGHFNPALPYSSDELGYFGFDLKDSRYTKSSNGDVTNVLFVEDPVKKGCWHPRIASHGTEVYNSLEDWQKEAYNRLYDEFFYRRHNAFWKDSAYMKLPELLAATEMIACGEDLGMIPDCVPDAMREMQILSLEIQRMPKSVTETFARPECYPYMSVCTTSTHDMNPLRAWWEEDMAMTQRYYNEVLHEGGAAPACCEPWICERILMQHLCSPAMLTVLPLQDWLSIDGRLRLEDPAKERINIPAIPRHYWRYRMHLTIESLLAETEFNKHISGMISAGGR